MTPRGRVHAALVAVRCPATIPERHPPTQPDAGRDGRVTTQVTTQIGSPVFPPVRLCPRVRAFCEWNAPSVRLRRVQRSFLRNCGALCETLATATRRNLAH